MKAGTAQKLILNMITTATMIQLGRVKGNKMVDMQLTNNKLFSRATQIVVNELKIPVSVAQDLLRQHKSVRNSIYAYNQKRDNKK
jgi:N-acetylmuramic acid 6-phosphate etherase